MTANDLTVLDLLDALLRIDSVNPGLDPGGAGEADIAAFVADWGRAAGLRTQVVEGTPGRPSVILRGGRNTGGVAGCCSAATSTPSESPAPPTHSRPASTATGSTPAAPTT